MKRTTFVFLVLVFLAEPVVGGMVSESDFKMETTQNLLNLATAAPDDPLYTQAVSFCHGFLVGAFHYYLASSSGPQGVKLVCLPDPPPSRNDAIKMFIEWVKAHPQYLQEKPVETEFRFLVETWPCASASPAATK